MNQPDDKALHVHRLEAQITSLLELPPEERKAIINEVIDIFKDAEHQGKYFIGHLMIKGVLDDAFSKSMCDYLEHAGWDREPGKHDEIEKALNQALEARRKPK